MPLKIAMAISCNSDNPSEKEIPGQSRGYSWNLRFIINGYGKTTILCLLSQVSNALLSQSPLLG